MSTKWEEVTPRNVANVGPHRMVWSTVVTEVMPDGHIIVTGDSVAHFQAWEFDADGVLIYAVTYTSEYAFWDVSLKDVQTIAQAAA